jgi:hypothetical protein
VLGDILIVELYAVNTAAEAAFETARLASAGGADARDSWVGDATAVFLGQARIRIQTALDFHGEICLPLLHSHDLTLWTPETAAIRRKLAAGAITQSECDAIMNVHDRALLEEDVETASSPPPQFTSTRP